MNVVPVRAKTRQHEHLVAEGCQRLEDGRELEGASLALRRPVLHGHAVRHIEGLEPVHRFYRGMHPQRERREHRVEERQRQGRAQSVQDSAS